MNGARIAILGAGRSGLSAAKAALSVGAIPTVYDRTFADAPKMRVMGQDLDALGVPFVGGWDQAFDGKVADLVVTSPGVPMQSEVLRGSVRNGVPVIGEIELAYRISKAPIVAVTGTNGKSTTAVMAYLTLEAVGEEPILCGNIFGSGYDEIPLTEAAIVATANQTLVAEVSSFQLEWIEDWRPKAAAITVIGSDHLDRYEGDNEQYAAAKRRLYENMRSPQRVILPAGFHPKPTNVDLWTFGEVGAHAFVDAQSLYCLEASVSMPDLPFEETTNLRNACTAALLACAATTEANAQKALDGLRRFRPLANRMEPVGSRNGISIINNSMCTNPEAVIASSLGLQQNQHILIGGKRKGLTFFELGDYLAGSNHRAYLFGADAQEINAQMGDRWPVFETLAEAFASAAKAAHNKEVIMLAPGCASQDQFEDFRHRGDVFKKIAKEWLSR